MIALFSIPKVDCLNVEQVYPCFVIRGKVTTYTEQPLTDSTLQRVEAAVQAAIDTGGLDEADTRVIAVNWRDLTTDPLPDDGGNNGGNNNGGGSSPSPAPTSEGNVDSPTNDGTVPIEREAGDDDSLKTWEISLIAVGAALLCCMGYLCFRRRAHDPIYDDDDDDDENGGSDNDSFHDEPGNKKEKTPLVVPTYEPPQPQQMQSQAQQPQNDPYRDPYNVPPTRTQQQESRSGSEGTPIEEESESSEEDEDDDENDEDEEGTDMLPSLEQSSQPSSNSRQTAQDNQMLGAYGNSLENQSNSQSKWDENMFVKNEAPPMESTSEEFSSEYSEEEVDEEYEIEYVEDEEGLQGVEEEYSDDDEDESYSDDYDDDDDNDDDDNEGIVEDEPGKTPILPWLAQEEQ